MKQTRKKNERSKKQKCPNLPRNETTRQMNVLHQGMFKKTGLKKLGRGVLPGEDRLILIDGRPITKMNMNRSLEEVFNRSSEVENRREFQKKEHSIFF